MPYVATSETTMLRKMAARRSVCSYGSALARRTVGEDGADIDLAATGSDGVLDVGDALDGEEDGRELEAVSDRSAMLTPTHGHVDGDEGEEDDGEGEGLVRALRPVAHGQEEAEDEKAEVDVVEHDVDVLEPLEAERRIGNRLGQDLKRDKVVAEGEPGEELPCQREKQSKMRGRTMLYAL